MNAFRGLIVIAAVIIAVVAVVVAVNKLRTPPQDDF